MTANEKYRTAAQLRVKRSVASTTDLIPCDACHLDSSQARVRPCLTRTRAPFSDHPLKVSPFSTLAAFEDDDAAILTLAAHSRAWIVVERKNGCQLHRQRPLRIRGRSCRLEVVGYASRPWMGNSIEPLVVGVGVLIKHGVDTAKLVGFKGGGIMLKSPHLKPRLLRPRRWPTGCAVDTVLA